MKKGYTLIELMIAVAIVGIISALVFRGFVNMKATALAGQSKANLGIIRASLNLYRVHYKTGPARLTGPSVPPEIVVNLPPPPLAATNLNTYGEFYCPRNPDASGQVAGWQILPNYAPNYDVQKLNSLSYQVINVDAVTGDLTINHPGGINATPNNPPSAPEATAEGWWYTSWNGGEVFPATQGEVTVPFPGGKRKGEYYTRW